MIECEGMAQETDRFEEMADWERVLEEINGELAANDPVASRCRLVTFWSRSNGRGRKPRRPRGVGLLVVDGTYAYQIMRGEICPRKKRGNHSQPDQLAAEILEHLPADERTADALLEIVLARASLGLVRNSRG